MTQLDTRLVATEALEIQKSVNELTAQLEEKKVQLRSVANGEILKIVVPGCGEVSVSRPRTGGQKTGTRVKLNEERLNLVPDLKKRLLEKGVIVEEDIISTSAAASVSIKPNV